MKQKLSPEMNRKAWLCAALIVLMMLLLGVGAFLLLTRPAEKAAPLLKAGADLSAAAQGLDDIDISAVLDPEGRTLSFTQEMTLTNRTGQEQSAVVLRSWSGAYLNAETSPCASEELYYQCYGAAFSPGGLRVDSAEVAGQPVQWAWLDEASTVLSLPAEWDTGESVRVRLECTVAIPDCASRFGYADGVFMLGNVFPVAALWEDGAWRTDAYVPVGDPFVSECANWHVTLSIPDGFTVAASSPGALLADGRFAFEAPAMRDFALVVSRDFVTLQEQAGDVLLTACAREEADAKAMLRYARQAMDSYGRRWGGYAYPAFTLAEAVFPYGGMEYPGLVMISADMLASGGQVLEYVVAHETAHQWWAVAVGSDGFHQPWQDESLCEYAWLDYVGDSYGADARAQMVFDRIEAALRITIPGSVTPGSPLDYFTDLTQYGYVVYQRGAAFWHALEIHLGKDGLDALLRDYQAQYRFRNATRDDLTRIINQHAGQDMSALMLDYLDTLMN